MWDQVFNSNSRRKLSYETFDAVCGFAQCYVDGMLEQEFADKLPRHGEICLSIVHRSCAEVTIGEY